MKLSKYNYCTYNKDNELLLFNSMQGTVSMLKVPQEYASCVHAALTKQVDLDSIDHNIYKELVDNKYIIEDTIDESAQLRKIYLDQIGDSQLQLTILPTEQCNFRCKYCYESFPDNTMNQEVKDSIIMYLKKNLHHFSSLHISWFGGEPLLELDTIEYLSKKIKEICAFYKKPYSASITTNGFLLDYEHFRRLSQCNVVYYQITIDGVQEVHDFQRPHVTINCSTYEKIISNLLEIKNKSHSKLVKFTLRSNFSKLHLDRIEEYKNCFHKLFGDDDRFQFFVRPVMDWGGERIEQFEFNLLEARFMDDFYDLLGKTQYNMHYIYSDFLDPGCAVCEAAKKNAYVIIPNGDIYKCTCNFSEEHGAKIGELLANGNMRLNETLANQWLCNMDSCKEECFFSPICLRESCPAIRVLRKKGSKKCPLEKRNLAKILQLLDLENKCFRRIG